MNTSIVSKKSLIITIIFSLIAVLVCSITAYFFGISSVKGDSIKQYVLTEDVKPGHSLKGKYTESYISSNDSINERNLVLDSSIIDDSIATGYMYTNSPITVTDLTTVDDTGRVFEVAFPITVEGSVANSIGQGDIVAIKLTYTDSKQEDATVVSRIKVKDVRTSNGASIVDDSSVAAFVIFDVTDVEQSDIKNALKEGDLYCSKYTRLDQEPLQKTYFVSEQGEAIQDSGSTEQ